MLITTGGLSAPLILHNRKKMMMTEKLMTLKKIKALADRGGTTGERVAAQNLLDKLLEKYGLFAEDLWDIERHECEFNYNTKFEKKLLLQLSCVVSDNYDKNTGKILWCRRYTNTTKLIFKLTVAEERQMQVWYALYKKQWRKELKRTQQAFIQKHSLTVTLDNDSLNKPMSDEDFYRMQCLMDGMESCPRNLSIDAGKE